MKISVVLPVFNELRHGYLQKILSHLDSMPQLEVIAVDGGSIDGTYELLSKHSLSQIIHAPNSTRARRLNLGMEAATNEIIFLHHPRSLPDPKAFQFLAEKGEKLLWGALRHRFDVDHPLLRFTSWYSNLGRGRRGIYYLDHCLFINRKIWPKGSQMADVPIYEDTFLCRQLREKGRPTLLPYFSTTSATRFVKNGLYKQSLLNQLTKIALFVGFSPQTINQWYERGLHLNQPQK